MIDSAAPIDAWLPTVWYGRFRPDLPDLCVGRWPTSITTETPWKLGADENPGEREALLAALTRPVPRRNGALDFLSGPDAVVSRPGSGDTVLALYEPPAPGWPWITLGRWPRDIGREVGAHRDVYTWDADMIEVAAHNRMATGVVEGVKRADFLNTPPAGTA